MHKTDLYKGVISIVFAAFCLYAVSIYNYLLYHSLVEVFSIVAFSSIFFIVWSNRRLFQDGFFLFLGISFLFVGFIDFIHALSYVGMGVFQGYGDVGITTYSTQLWLSARFLQAVSLLLAPLFIKRKLAYNATLLAYAIVGATILLSIFYWRVFPVTFVEGFGVTRFKEVGEYVISFILVASLLTLWSERGRIDKTVTLFVGASIVASIASEIVLSSYTNLFGIENVVGHVLKIGAVYLLYRGLVESIITKPNETLFKSVSDKEQALAAERIARHDSEVALKASEQKMKDMEAWTKISIDRELKMVELKKEIQELTKKLEEHS